ncbi:unnamed protein product [Lactuca saligna]|uniref:Uncharacterized protein n=1 Tax=Lactuca saligna TaxID=75948 RepID=A0AA36A1B0_LACSI|nr:unnamed protein product [Lactuca saligna]
MRPFVPIKFSSPSPKQHDTIVKPANVSKDKGKEKINVSKEQSPTVVNPSKPKVVKTTNNDKDRKSKRVPKAKPSLGKTRHTSLPKTSRTQKTSPSNDGFSNSGFPNQTGIHYQNNFRLNNLPYFSEMMRPRPVESNPFMYQNRNHPMNSILGPYCGFCSSIGGNHMFGGNSGFPMINQFGGNTQFPMFDQFGMPVNYGFPYLGIPTEFTNSPFFPQTKPQKKTPRK